MRNTELVIADIKSLIKEVGYIYALSMILFEDFHVDPEKLHELNNRERVSTKEAAMLIGFLIQDKLNFSTPPTTENLIQLKLRTYELLDELHESHMIPFFEKMEESFQTKDEEIPHRKAMREFFGKGDMMTESIFYSGTGVYDFQYNEFLEKKYKYDKDWLLEKMNFDTTESMKIAYRIKDLLQEKSIKVHLYSLKERVPQIVRDMKKKYPDEDVEKNSKEIISGMELHQYVELFFEHLPTEEKEFDKNVFKEDGWKSFYIGIIDLFTIRKSDFTDGPLTDSFFEHFSISPQENTNSQFTKVGNFNIVNAKPLIKLNDDQYFVSNTFLLFEAIYESPFYWMIQDKNYADLAGDHRGDVGEEITYDFLVKVFGESRTFKSVRITPKKGQDATDIDVLCILGSKVLCVQVKSKKLTELSRTGDDEQLQEDFKGAVQDAYGQGILSRQMILGSEAKFFDSNGNEIILSEEIDEVYIMGITTENYPSLTHQAHFMLEKEEKDPFPIFLTIFDLELLTHYLNDPYDLLYYVRQRTSLMDYFIADEEIVFLGYHLNQKLWKVPKVDHFTIDNNFGQLIDRNYFPFKAKLEISDEGDVIKNRWKNQDFTKLTEELKSLDDGKITDIIFHLLDWSGNARKNLTDFIIQTKQKTLADGKFHNFSIPPDDTYYPRVGITYVSLDSDNIDELSSRLKTLCEGRKYKSEGDIWIGFGSLLSSNAMIDLVAYSEKKWEYSKDLEDLAKIMLEGSGQGRYVRLGEKIGRNDRCKCGSPFKYKKCCGN